MGILHSGRPLGIKQGLEKSPDLDDFTIQTSMILGGGSTNGIQNGWFRKWKIPSRNGWWLGVPLFQETTISCWWSHLVSQWYPNVPGNHRYYPVHIQASSQLCSLYVSMIQEIPYKKSPSFPIRPHSEKADPPCRARFLPHLSPQGRQSGQRPWFLGEMIYFHGG